MAQSNKSKYNSKAKESFKTKFDIYLFEKALNQTFETISKDDFESFEIGSELLNIFLTEYWQELKGYKLNSIPIEEIESCIYKWERANEKIINELEQKYINETFKIKFTEDDFNELLSIKTCNYCGITLEQINQLVDKRSLYKKNYRGYSLEIDRLNSNYEYSKENCTMACYWCNNAKTDEFTPKESILIGEAIKEIFKTRLNPPV